MEKRSRFDSMPDDTQYLIAKLVLRGQSLPKERLALRLVNRQFADRTHDVYLSLARCRRGFQLCKRIGSNTHTTFVVQLTQLVIDTCRAPEVMASRVYPFPTQLYARVVCTVYMNCGKHQNGNEFYNALRDHAAPMIKRAFADGLESIEWCVHYLNGMFCHLNIRGGKETRYGANPKQYTVARFLEVAMGKKALKDDASIFESSDDDADEDALVSESNDES